MIDEVKNTPKKGKSVFPKIIIGIVSIVALVEATYGGYMLYEKYKSKFKSINVEIGTSEKVSIKDFIKDEKYLENSKIVTNLDEVDYSKVGEYNVVLSHDDREEEVKLNLVDTTPPQVTFTDVTKYIDYQINADDFIQEKQDLSETTAEVINAPEINEFRDYEINVVVKDIYGNETSNVCKLSIKWIKDEFAMEKGHDLTKEDLLFNPEQDANLLDSKQLKEISNSAIGDYEIVTTKDGINHTTVVKVTDLTPPTLKLKNVTIYDDEKVSGKNSFITSAKDASGEVTTTMKTTINYSKLGTQEIVIEAVDKYGNKTEGTAILTIRKDTVGPVFSGLSTINVSKGATINYEKRSKC